jgi:preprotein translocase subunit SecG
MPTDTGRSIGSSNNGKVQTISGSSTYVITGILLAFFILIALAAAVFYYYRAQHTVHKLAVDKEAAEKEIGDWMTTELGKGVNITISNISTYIHEEDVKPQENPLRESLSPRNSLMTRESLKII